MQEETIRLRRVGLSICILMAMMSLGINHAMADSVIDMCKKKADVCACAAKQLKADIGDEKYMLYEAIGMKYIANKKNGMGMGDAWDAAVRDEAGKRGKSFVETLNQTNEIGKTHRKAMKGCS